jgi:hypothetical protein
MEMGCEHQPGPDHARSHQVHLRGACHRGDLLEAAIVSNTFMDYISGPVFVATDPEAREMEARMRFPGYSVVRARNGTSERWIIRCQDGSVTSRGAVGKHVGAFNGYKTEEAAWEIVRLMSAGRQR